MDAASRQPEVTTANSPETVADDLENHTTWLRALTSAAVAYVASRLFVLLGAGVIAAERGVEQANETGERPVSAVRGIIDVLVSWDGQWYLEIVRRGYPTFVPPDITYEQVEARAAFFPGYPYLARLVDLLLPGGDTFAALSLNVLLGATAILGVGLLARAIAGIEVARRSMILTAVFPGSFVLSFAYSEALLITVASLCLLALVRERWVTAGLLAAAATAVRPNALAVIAACAVAAWPAVRRGDWRALAAPLLAPVGFIAFQLAVDARANERGIWLRVQREAWDEGTSFGLTAISGFADFLRSPLSSPTDLVTSASLIGLIVLIAASWRHRLPAPLNAYSAVVLLLMLMPSTVTARPRFLYTAFPLLISLASWFTNDRRVSRRTRDDLWLLLLAVCAAGLVTLTGLYGAFAVIP
jgi:hypothetical protein